MKLYSDNRGVALITVLFIVALVASLATVLLTRLAKDIRRTEYNRNQGQMLHYLFGVESWAIGRLKQDRQANTIDHKNEVWTNTITQQIVDNQANINATIQDLQAKFNLNNLIGKQSKNAADQKNHHAYLKRLLQQLEIEPAVADTIADWIDSDAQTRFPNGAEDEFYLNLNQPYRTANQAITGLSELYLIKGVTQEIYQKLQPHVTVLPVITTININTASAKVLAALSPDLTESVVQSIMEQRKNKPFKSTSEFIALALKLTKKNQLTPKNLSQLIGVSSQYFLCHSEIIMRNSRVKYNSLIYRTAYVTNIIHRHREVF